MKEIPIVVKCPDCESEDVFVNSDMVLTSYPPLYGYECRRCGRNFRSPQYEVEREEGDKPEFGNRIVITNNKWIDEVIRLRDEKRT